MDNNHYILVCNYNWTAEIEIVGHKIEISSDFHKNFQFELSNLSN